MMKKKISYLLISLFLATDLMADMNLKLYKLVKDADATKGKNATYIAGLGKGITWTSSILEVEKGISFLCLPPKLALNGDNYKQILDNEISNNHYEDDTPIELILVIGLMHTFPCDTKKK